MAKVADAVRAAEDRLKTARFGLADMKDPKRALSGLFNAVVFGRMTTFALQNMRSEVEGFDEWYNDVQTGLAADPLMKFFKDMRTEIEHTAEEVAHRGFKVQRLSVSDIFNLPRPPGAVGFFIGDATGGSGWEVRAADGSKEKYYIDPPDDWGVAALVSLKNVPEQFKTIPAETLVGKYLDRMKRSSTKPKQGFPTRAR